MRRIEAEAPPVHDLPLRRRDRARLDRGEIVFASVRGVLFGESPKPTDACQGVIGDCYCLSALSALAHAREANLRRVLRETGDGRFEATFHRRLEGGGFRAETVAVDDAFPLRKSDGRPIYARSRPLSDGRQEIWPLVAEKAYAAWRGGYDVMGEGGIVEETLEELTGEPTRMLFTAEAHPEELWDMLSRATHEGWPTVLCTYGRVERPAIDELGFHPNHIVIFLGVHTWMGRRIVWLRDPFDVPACGTLVSPDPHGVYTIAWREFLNYFAEVAVNASGVHDIVLSPYPAHPIGEALDRSYVFATLPVKARRALARDFTRAVVAAGDSIARAGDPPEHLHLLEHGSAAIEVPARRGKAERVAVGRAGDSFGDVHILDDRPYDAHLRALTPVAVYRLHAEKLRAWVKRYPEIEARLRRRFDLRVTMLDWSQHQLTDIDVDALLRASEELDLARGAKVFSEGDPAEAIYLVVVGRVEARHRKNGRSTRLAIVGAGEVFGEVEVLRRVPRLATARVVSRKAVLLRIDLGLSADAMAHFDVVQRQLASLADRRERARRRELRRE
jgi:CRP-like cAMP-binding protein